ncbi:PP2C family protein-serine/threonine phosphatase [Motilibacter aurantiacus]|uniref:PP2C family protein-serine/threonine phosphatase n=1 Tax=Motilibacter aurantiacus TaxID=2714955 RepID=UPI00140A37A8|nr:PP2C family protein-serine/threonine phosphatase [Motilibacter aurantiacus]NHC46607.1 serine/threonine-protein phosphatase [Motilibacter aurantiacus]
MRRTGPPIPTGTSWSALCLGLLGLLATADVAVGQAHNFTGTYAVPPFLAGALLPARRTALIGALAVLCALTITLLDAVDGLVGTIRVGAVLLSAVSAPWVAHVREAREQRLAKLTRVAEVAQKAVLAPLPTVSGPLAVASAYRSASDEAAIGGDLIDLVETASSTRLIVGDVRGKGLTAVQLAASTLRSFRDACVSGAGLQEAVAQIDRRLVHDLGDEDFVTAALADVSPAGLLELVNCAHPPPLLVRAGQPPRLLEPASPDVPFGLGPAPQPLRLQLEPGDRLLFYTDGLIEARSRRGGFVPLEELTATLGTAVFEDALDEVLTALRGSVAGRFGDDLALLLVEYDPAHTGRRREVATLRPGSRVTAARAAAEPRAS